MNHMIKIVIDFMLPKSKDDPTFLYIMLCNVGITLDVTSDLLTPKIGIRLRRFEVEGTAVPKARV